MGRKWGRECREKNMSKGEMDREREGFLSQLCWLVVAVMVGNTPNTTVVPLASTLLTNLSLSHSVFQCTSQVDGVSLTALLA